jgi:DNA-binding LacI/PurR family transcriptional regulator
LEVNRNVPLNSFGALPRYMQVKVALRREIVEGPLAPGDLLPSERLLCERFGVSNITVRRALRDLVQDGLIYRENGVGTFVASPIRKLRVALVFQGFEEEGWRRRSQMFGALIGSVGQVLWEQGCTFSITDVLNEKSLLDVLDSIINEQTFDGILLRTASDPSAAAIDLLTERSFPYVVVKKRVPGRHANCVVLDNHQSARMATAHLLELGHRRIGCILGPRSSTTFRDRADGYADALSEWGLSVNDDWLRFGTSTFEDAGYAEGAALLDLPTPPTAVLVGVDLMIQGVYQAVKDRRRRIPRQVALVGFDEAGFGERYDPPLTAVSTTEYDLGRASARLLMQVLSGERSTPTEVVLEPALTIRSSTGNKPLLMEVRGVRL